MCGGVDPVSTPTRMSRTRTVQLYSAVSIVAAGLLVFILAADDNITFPERISTTGKILPAREWLLVKDSDGNLQSSLINYLTGAAEAYSVSKFERGDNVRFHLTRRVNGNGLIAAGDTIGYLSSNTTELRLAQLRGEIETARASLQLALAAQKESVIEEARQRVRYAEVELVRRQQLVDRIAPQRANGFISDEEYEVAAGELGLAEANLSIAQAQLQSALTGAQPEQIELERARIASLEREIRTLVERQSLLTLTAPIDGMIRRSFAADTLLILSDAQRHIILIPIAWSSHAEVRAGNGVEVRIPGHGDALRAEVLEVDRTARVLQGRPIAIAVAELEDVADRDLIGLPVRCRVEGATRSLSDHVRRFFTSLLS